MSKADDTQRRITSLALKALPQQGYGGLTVGFMAGAAHMSKSGVFARFGGQAAFQCAVIDAASQKFSAEVIEPARHHTDPAQRLAQIARSWTRWLTTDGLGMPCPVFQAAIEGPALTDEARAHALQVRSQFPAYLAHLATRARDAGAFCELVAPDQFAFEFDGIGLSTGFTALDQSPDRAVSHAEAAFSALFNRARA